ncbi:hypothetical protein M3202_21340 [Alkalihalobacillus oceani]|uniref:Uncharacterized protein n=1 Tax=Halalkalibacter oceani TaxID=1653776 RepID=A0A9X2DW17_9BACI|nr:hypothetical protein [Halalkalibacter oceani]MCM3716592.1 hypothetical protein [Halalkalibacter oceani]
MILIEKLSLKLVSKYVLLLLLKDGTDLSTDYCYKQLNELIPPPPQPGAPTRKYSRNKVQLYLKELTAEEKLFESKAGKDYIYRISGKGEQELSNREDLLSQLLISYYGIVNVSKMLASKPGTPLPYPEILVPKRDREFVRSLVSIKDIIRVYTLFALQQKPEQSVSELHDAMLSYCGWTCSLPYWHLIVRNEMTEGVDLDSEPLANPVILLKSKYLGKVNRRKKRVYSIADQASAEEWLKIYLETADFSVRKAISYTKLLLDVLQKNP